MSQIGTVVSTAQSVPTASTVYDTANAFLVGLADWGPSSKPVTVTTLAGVVALVGPRSTTNATLYDSLDVFFREGGRTATVSRVVGPNASAASLGLNGVNGSASLLV